MSDEPIMIIACPPADDARALDILGISNFQAAPGSEIVRCEKCSRKVWIGPGQMSKAKDPTVRALVLCYFCGLSMAGRNEWEVKAVSKTGHTFDFKL